MHKIFISSICLLLLMAACTREKSAVKYEGLSDNLVRPETKTILEDKIIYHFVRLDQQDKILPWYSENPGESYDQVIRLCWDFWKNMEKCSNGTKYYMNHQVWSERHDRRGLGGDQLQMAMSAWDLLYNYTGDESVIENMKYMADYYLENSLSSPDASWPNLPYPYNMDIHSGKYDGDMILGVGYTQPDKAGSFAYELLHLYKKTGDEKYLDAAVKIADVLAEKVQPGDNDNSPWPFKVHAVTGETGILIENERWYEGMDKDLKKTTKKTVKSSYTTFYPSTLGLFQELIKMQKGNTSGYQKAFDITLNWMKEYPAKTMKWGPFFEDVPRWSDTQINAVTYAMYLMDNRDLDPNWKGTVKAIFEWVHRELDSEDFVKYGVTATNEQTAYKVEGNSHSSRQASMELRYWELTGDSTYVENAIRMLNWATYMVDCEGKNFYPTNAIWMTDGYGDYVRHYLRAMAAAPQLAPASSDHLLRTSSIVNKIAYEDSGISYSVFDDSSEELLRLTSRPKSISVDGSVLDEVTEKNLNGWYWEMMPEGGVLTIRHTGRNVEINK